MGRKKPELGAGQWEVLRWVSENPPVTVAQVAQAFAQSHGLARTTVLTVMERLREKGYLTREKRGAIYEYSPVATRSQMMHEKVGQFVEETLGGSFAPFLAYLAQETKVSDEQLQDLKRLVQELEASQAQTSTEGQKPSRENHE
jgi:predicted transcriptional regulator